MRRNHWKQWRRRRPPLQNNFWLMLLLLLAMMMPRQHPVVVTATGTSRSRVGSSSSSETGSSSSAAGMALYFSEDEREELILQALERIGGGGGLFAHEQYQNEDENRPTTTSRTVRTVMILPIMAGNNPPRMHPRGVVAVLISKGLRMDLIYQTESSQEVLQRRSTKTDQGSTFHNEAAAATRTNSTLRLAKETTIVSGGESSLETSQPKKPEEPLQQQLLYSRIPIPPSYQYRGLTKTSSTTASAPTLSGSKQRRMPPTRQQSSAASEKSARRQPKKPQPLPSPAAAASTSSSSSPASSSSTTPWVRQFLARCHRDVLLPLPRDYCSDNFNLSQLPPVIEQMFAGADNAAADTLRLHPPKANNQPQAVSPV